MQGHLDIHDTPARQRPDAQDMDLVREFVRDNSDAAFAELVRRHLNLVYSVARRCTGNDEDARDVAQAVFIILARKAAGLSPKTLFPGWLYETTRFTAARLLRTDARRRAREQEAYMRSTLNETSRASVWEQLSRHLETAMSRLAERDRALLVLRFYQNKSGPEAAALLGVCENTLHKRVARALEKLRLIFAKRGVTLSGETIAGAISANSILIAPAGLATAVAAGAKGAAVGGSTLTLVKGALKIMAWTKMKTAVVVGACVLLTAGTTTTVIICNQPRPVQGIPQDWSVLSGTSDQWNWSNGAIKGSSVTGDAILSSSRKYGDITLSAIASTAKRGADFAIRMQDADNGYIAVFTPDGTPWAAENGSCIKLEKRVSGNTTELGIFKRRGLAQSAKLAVTAKGSQIEVRLNDVIVLKARDTTFASGYIGLRVYGDPTKPADSTFSNLMFY